MKPNQHNRHPQRKSYQDEPLLAIPKPRITQTKPNIANQKAINLERIYELLENAERVKMIDWIIKRKKTEAKNTEEEKKIGDKRTTNEWEGPPN